ncbi:uncharacterized protein LOC117650526 [Thrips palmi]|uniref:Uncharacterized protein LOC117650526 n=1 Tax=Thrips palmi TaxID=161013 RepID=A0A6P8ZWY2_THRPL|nr:uncharacterized protein LOC117650526 [Thrips palmi]
MKTKYEKMNEAMERDGDPDDDFLNHVETDLILPKLEDLRIRNVVCKADKEALEACRQKYGLPLSFMCFFDFIFYGLCISKARDSEDIQDDCMEEYLAVRSRYRLTKDPAMLKRLKAMVFPHKHQPDPSKV